MKVRDHETSLNRTDHSNNKKRLFLDSLRGITEQNRLQVKETFLANHEAPQNRAKQVVFFIRFERHHTIEQYRGDFLSGRTEQSKQGLFIWFVRHHRTEQNKTEMFLNFFLSGLGGTTEQNRANKKDFSRVINCHTVCEVLHRRTEHTRETLSWRSTRYQRLQQEKQ